MRQNRGNYANWYTVAGRTFYMYSIFEMQWAAVLQLCQTYPNLAREVLGHQVIGWDYEPKEFRFYPPYIPKRFNGKTRGATVYTPDFKVIKPNGYVWHETKGHLDRRDTAKMLAFRTYYHKEDLIFLTKRMPKGLTPASRNLQARYQRLQQAGIYIKNVMGIIKSLKPLFTSVAVEGKVGVCSTGG